MKTLLLWISMWSGGRSRLLELRDVLFQNADHSVFLATVCGSKVKFCLDKINRKVSVLPHKPKRIFSNDFPFYTKDANNEDKSKSRLQHCLKLAVWLLLLSSVNEFLTPARGLEITLSTKMLYRSSRRFVFKIKKDPTLQNRST